jgi:hypothetical protein
MPFEKPPVGPASVEQFNLGDAGVDEMKIATEAVALLPGDPRFRDAISLIKRDPEYAVAFRDRFLEKIRSLMQTKTELYDLVHAPITGAGQSGAHTGKLAEAASLAKGRVPGPKLAMSEVISAALGVAQVLDETRNSNEFERAPKTIPEGMLVLPAAEEPHLMRPFTHLAPLVPSESVPLEPEFSVNSSFGPPLTPSGSEHRDLHLGYELYAGPVQIIADRLVNSVIEPLPPDATLQEKQRYQREATAIKNLRLIWDNFPDFKQVIISEVWVALYGLFDKQSPEAVGRERFDQEVVSSLRLAVEHLFQERGQQIKDRLDLASRR